MNRSVEHLAEKTIARFGLQTIADVIRVLPISMCHIVQEPRVFGTFQERMVRLAFPESEWAKHDEIYRHFRDDVIPGIRTIDYLENLLSETPRRLPCFCSQMADVAAEVVSRMLGVKVYVLRNIYVNYLFLPQRWHCINAIVSDGRTRYFDVSAYAQVLEKSTGRLIRPERLAGFDASDIDESFIVSDQWLQSEPFGRRIYREGDRLLDSFYPSPLSDKPVDEFFRVVG